MITEAPQCNNILRPQVNIDHGKRMGSNPHTTWNNGSVMVQQIATRGQSGAGVYRNGKDRGEDIPLVKKATVFQAEAT